MFDFPNKKTFEQDFISEKWKLLFVLRYEQATLEEFFEFYRKSEIDQKMELYQIIKDCIPYSFFQKILKKILPWYRVKLERNIKYQQIVEDIQNNRFRIHESIFDEYDKKKWKGWKGSGKWLFTSTLQSICSQYCTPISEIMNLTLEQFFYLSDGLRFTANEMTKEWQAINNYALRDTKKAQESAERIRKAFKE